MSKIISVFGPPGSGKTTVSVALSHALADKKFNVCIVCCDDVTPTIPTLLPQSVNRVTDVSSKIHSIGKILNSIEYSTEDILQQCAYSKKYSKIVLLGYALGENKFTYPQPTDYDIYSFYSKLSTMVDYIIVDCSSDLSNPLTKVALEHSDNIIRLGGSNYKDITYFASAMDIIPEDEVKKEDHIVLFPNINKNDTIEDLSDFYGSIDYKIKNNPDVLNMFKFGECFVKEFPQSYKSVINKIIEEINFS